MIYQLEAEKRFPSRIRPGLRAVGWIEGEVQDRKSIEPRIAALRKLNGRLGETGFVIFSQRI
jgi:predicted DNA-binding transcriptional regulator AlpA